VSFSLHSCMLVLKCMQTSIQKMSNECFQEKNSHWVVPSIHSVLLEEYRIFLTVSFCREKELMSAQIVNKKEGINL